MKVPLIRGVRRLAGAFSTYFLAGLFALAPLLLTVGVLYWLFMLIDNQLQYVTDLMVGQKIPGLGFVFMVVIVLLCGAIASKPLGRRVLRFLEYLLSKLPVIYQIYNGVKQIEESLSMKDKGNFLEVVFVEFPKKGTYTPALVTSESVTEAGRQMLTIFIPTAPNPTTGFVQVVPRDGVVHTDMSIDDCLTMVVSAGKRSFDEVSDTLSGRFSSPSKG